MRTVNMKIISIIFFFVRKTGEDSFPVFILLEEGSPFSEVEHNQFITGQVTQTGS